MFKKGIERRRSDRLLFTIPVRIQGKSKEGETFVREGSAIEVNLHGAQIRIEKPVLLGRQVRLTNLITRVASEFRVVRILETSEANGMSFSVEAVELNRTFWGIHFPSQPKKPLESRALLECCRCHTLSLLPISLTDVEILSTGGVLMRPCAACTTRTPWTYSRKKTRESEESCESQLTGENELIASPFATDGRLDGGALLQRPISLRTTSGDAEMVQTESASSSGISCTSERNYEFDQELTLRWAHPASARNYEAKGRVIRRLDIGGSKRKIYNIRYASPPVILAEASSRKAPKIYFGFGLLLSAAAALIEPNIRTLTSSVSAHTNTTRQIIGLGAALLAVCLAYKAWKSILACEPEDRTVLRRRHRIAAGLAVALFCGALLMGISQGLSGVREHADAQIFLRDLAIASILEQNIDTAENRVLNAPGDYVDACSTLELLIHRWLTQIASLSGDVTKLRQSRLEHAARPAAGIARIQEIITLDEQKACLVQQQIRLRSQTQNIPSEKQLAYWNSNFLPLRQKILTIDAQKEDLLQSLVAEK